MASPVIKAIHQAQLSIDVNAQRFLNGYFMAHAGLAGYVQRHPCSPSQQSRQKANNHKQMQERETLRHHTHVCGKTAQVCSTDADAVVRCIAHNMAKGQLDLM